MENAEITDRVERLAEAVKGQTRVLAMMLSHQKLHNEMLAKVLETVTSGGDGTLEDMVEGLVKDSAEHGRKIEAIFDRVYGE